MSKIKNIVIYVNFNKNKQNLKLDLCVKNVMFMFV
jgi:hypothetical protein